MKLEDFKVIPVVVLQDEEDAKRKLSGLVEGGILVAEITFRTAYALDGIRYAIAHYPELLVGAGTVINATQCKQAIEAGCQFIVSPGFSKEVAICCAEHHVQYLPGCVTPTEIMMALDAGITTVKFFPAQVYGGLKAIEAIGAAFPNVRFVPTGGINADNLLDYLCNKQIAAVGGSWMMKGDIKEHCLEINAILSKG